MIKYIGSKRALLPAITELIGRVPQVRTVLDLFSGTSRVGHALKGLGYQVFANDHNSYAATLGRCYVQADAERWAEPAARLVEEFNALPGRAGYFTETFCINSRFMQPKNGERIDAIREAIAKMDLPDELEAVMLVALMEAADRVDSTTGVQMAYLKQWSPRSHQDLCLRVPALLPSVAHGPCRAYQLEAVDFARSVEGDLAYLDPPYNQHRYHGNYHVWESLVRWDKPEVYGVACKRIDCRSRRSPFNSRTGYLDAFSELIGAIRAPWIVLSFSDEGFLSREHAEAFLSDRGDVQVFEHDHARYIGSAIGIYNRSGQKTGTVGHRTNTERLYVVGPHPLELPTSATFELTSPG